MIERMAKGMFDATMERRYGDLPQNIPVWPPMREIEQEWLGHARAALTAMLEPSDAMAEAGEHGPTTASPDGDFVSADDARAIFRTMVQAALDEKPS